MFSVVIFEYKKWYSYLGVSTKHFIKKLNTTNILIIVQIEYYKNTSDLVRDVQIDGGVRYDGPSNWYSGIMFSTALIDSISTVFCTSFEVRYSVVAFIRFWSVTIPTSTLTNTLTLTRTYLRTYVHRPSRDYCSGRVQMFHSILNNPRESHLRSFLPDVLLSIHGFKNPIRWYFIILDTRQIFVFIFSFLRSWILLVKFDMNTVYILFCFNHMLLWYFQL